MILTADMPQSRNIEVLLDGVAVTMSCFAADDEAGWVDLWVRDDKGLSVVDDDQLRSERRFGRVQFVAAA